MNTPLVSVIMGIYNCADSLNACIGSLLAQTYTNWELIMCDDCSTDNTYEVAKSISEKHSNITVIRNPENKKLAYSLNACLALAKGEYVARMDADDLCMPERFEKQVAFLQAHPYIDVVGSAIIIYDENGDRETREISEFPVARDLIRSTTFFHPTIMMKKSCYDALGGYTVAKRTRKGQDVDLWFRFFANGYKGANIKDPLLKYHDGLFDYKKKRKFRYSWDMTKTRLIGFRNNKFPIHLYPLAFRPIISVMVPSKIIQFYHKKRRR